MRADQKKVHKSSARHAYLSVGTQGGEVCPWAMPHKPTLSRWRPTPRTNANADQRQRLAPSWRCCAYYESVGVLVLLATDSVERPIGGGRLGGGGLSACRRELDGLLARVGRHGGGGWAAWRWGLGGLVVGAERLGGGAAWRWVLGGLLTFLTVGVERLGCGSWSACWRGFGGNLVGVERLGGEGWAAWRWGGLAVVLRRLYGELGSGRWAACWRAWQWEVRGLLVWLVVGVGRLVDAVGDGLGGDVVPGPAPRHS